MMQDGDAASFALHIIKPSVNFEPTPKQLLGWAWSSYVRHAVVINPLTSTATIRRWDEPTYEEDRIIASERDARSFIRELERLPKPVAEVSGPNVIASTLRAFTLLRTAIIQDHRGTERDVVVAFNAALLLAEKWRDSTNRIPSIGLAETIESLRSRHRPGFAVPISSSVRAYPVGDFVKTLLDQIDAGAPYLLDAGQLIRHASGLLNQEAHRQLAKPLPRFFMPPLFPKAFASTPGAKRKKASGFLRHTPRWLARALIENALRWREIRPDDHLDVLDPACGSGIFLIETVRELERFSVRKVQLRGMESSELAGIMTEFCVGEASRDLAYVSVNQLIRYPVNSLLEADWGQPDIILMNPPFKAWEALEDPDREIVEKALRSHMEGRPGRPDLCYAFIARAAMALKPGGALAFVVPSAFFKAKTATNIRGLLSSGEFRVRMVGLFRGYETFEGAQIEAAAIVVSRSQIDSPIRVVIAESDQAAIAVRLLRNAPPGHAVKRAGIELYNIPAGSLSNKTWDLNRQEDRQFADLLRATTSTRVQDLFTIRLGIRGVGPKRHGKVLVLDEERFSRLITTHAERKYFRPIADLIKNGRIIPTGHVFYPYGPDGSLQLATPEAVAAAVPAFYHDVLLPAKKPMQDRKSLHRNWWEPSEPVATWLAAHEPRIVSQAYGRRGNFAFDEIGNYAVVAGHGWCWNGAKVQKNVMLAYLAILNSRVFERLLSIHCRRIQAPRFELAAHFVHSIPLPDITSTPGELADFGQRIHSGQAHDDNALDSAVLAAYGVTQSSPASRAIEKQFKRLADQWRRDIGPTSSAARMAQHPAYQEIIRMGDAVVPCILAEIEREPDHWFIALYEITGADPVRKAHRGDIEKMAEDWVAWGKKQGLTFLPRVEHEYRHARSTRAS